MDKFCVRKAIVEDLLHLPGIECSAAALFRSVPAVAHFADGDPSLTPQKQLELCKDGTIWVVAGGNGDTSDSPRPYAFVATERIDDSLYIWELSVHTGKQRQGLSSMLLNAVFDHARQKELTSISLMTERDIPWNGPMYRKKGFKEVQPSSLGPGHVQIAKHEEEQGLDMSRRAMMAITLEAYLNN